ncbi:MULTISPECIES: sigma-54 interaction domain-containing protein [Bacillus]|uniref:sigma-54 interaction domain-containing protein n=1 Tax=Bacillus TaxID=1386 RepID=UPI0002F547FF|nr:MULTISPECIES: sigma 54-interacting transcriptional regulator [Bacillus]
MEYNSEEVLSAWKTFVGQGTLLKDKIRPEIARSWVRCKESGLDPWSVSFPKPSKDLLKQKRTEYEYFLKMANPVLGYLLAMFNSNITICDQNGFIFELLTPLELYPRTFGTYVDEAVTGSGSVTISLIEKKPYRAEGYENYRMVAQGYSGVSAPIQVNGEMIGVLTITNPFVSLPDYALDCCVEAAEIISDFLQKDNKNMKLMLIAKRFERLIEKSNQAIVVLDDSGRVLITNKVGRNIVSQYDEWAYGTQSFGDYLMDRKDLSYLLDGQNNLSNQLTIGFKRSKTLKNNRLLLQYNKKIQLPNSLIHNVLVFEIPSMTEEKKSEPVARNNEQFVDYIGKSPAWTNVDKIVKKVATYNTNVLLLGETGTGKEVVAKAIHRLSGRKGKFVAINCGAIPKELFASELFGYESGAFTGAKAGGAIGKFEYAHEGTLFLDEIGEMPLDMQVSLLRVIQEQTITRIGSNKSQKCDVRIIAATNQNMRKVIQEGAFRSDLYYRLSVIEIQLPLLKDRGCDIALLAEYFNGNLSEQLKIPHQLLSEEVIDALRHYDWPGNVRELKNIIEKILILSIGEPITIDLLPDYIKEQIGSKDVLPSCQVEPPSTERERICKCLEKHRGNISQVAKELGMARNTLYRKLEKYQIEMKTFAVNK